MDYRNIRKSTGWIYNAILPSLHLEYRMIFRKIYLSNRHGVPANKPVLIAANHPTAFIDPIFFCLFFDPPVYNMTRGDIFAKPFYRKLLEECNMFPVYRKKDGYGERDRNDEVFDYVKGKLLEGVAVNIFVEGEHHLDKRVLPMQKGIARIAFGTYQDHRLDDLQIVPVGCNYNSGEVLRDEAKINVGKPIFVKDYWPKYQENPAAAINQLCGDIRKALIEICYHIENKDDDQLAEQLLTLWRSDHPAAMIPIVENSPERFFAEKDVLNRLNNLEPQAKAELKTKSNSYFDALTAANLRDDTLMQPNQGHWTWLFFFVLACIPSFLGYLLSWPIRSLARYVTRKKVKKREFRTSILLGVGTLGTFFYYILLFLIGLLFSWPLLVAIAILIPFLTWLSIFWRERLIHWLEARKAKRHPKRAFLLNLRHEISY